MIDVFSYTSGVHSIPPLPAWGVKDPLELGILHGEAKIVAIVALAKESFAKKFKPITSVAPKTSGSRRDTGRWPSSGLAIEKKMEE